MKNNSEVLLACCKITPPWLVIIYQKITAALPDIAIWLTILFTLLQIYVLLRDKFWHQPK